MNTNRIGPILALLIAAPLVQAGGVATPMSAPFLYAACEEAETNEYARGFCEGAIDALYGSMPENARGGVALKHRHRIHLSLFGQLMASFEYLLKDFVAKAIDLSPQLDGAVQNAKWVTVDAGRVLANRFSATTPGAMLVHSTLGWHTPSIANSRYGVSVRRTHLVRW